jgi:hypothetical protein
MIHTVLLLQHLGLPRSARCHGFDGKKKWSKAKADAMDLQVANDQIMKKSGNTMSHTFNESMQNT